jgi:glutaredoxin 3
VIMIAKKITVYGAVSCPWCVKLKDWLESKKVKFTYVDVAKPENQAKVVEMAQKSGQMGIPVTIIDDDEVIIGFDRDKITKLAGIN